MDGVEAGSGRPAENVDIFYALTAHRDLTIGQLRNGSCTIGVEADVDGVRLWSRALTAPEVAQRFIGSQPPSCSPPSLVPVAPALEGTTINLPILTDAASFEVSWGDGNETSTTTHVYADDGVYAVTVRPSAQPVVKRRKAPA